MSLRRRLCAGEITQNRVESSMVDVLQVQKKSAVALKAVCQVSREENCLIELFSDQGTRHFPFLVFLFFFFSNFLECTCRYNVCS